MNHSIHGTLYSVHCTPYTVHSTLCTIHALYRRYTVLCALCTIHGTLYPVHCVLYSAQCTYTVHCTLCTVHYTRYTVLCALYMAHCTLFTIQGTLYSWPQLSHVMGAVCQILNNSNEYSNFFFLANLSVYKSQLAKIFLPSKSRKSVTPF